MIRVGFFSYSELPDEAYLTARLGEPAARLTHGRRQKARTETLMGWCLLAAMLPGADLSRIERTREGRPFFQDRPDVDFNLSHTNGMIACALEIGEAPRVGVDVERVTGRSIAEMERVAERWFTETERARWGNDPTEQTFLAIWTAKEAAAKWDGGGLRILRALDIASAPLREHSYRVDDAILTLACSAGREPPDEIEPFSI